MAVYTDVPSYAGSLLHPGAPPRYRGVPDCPAEVRPLIEALFADGAEIHTAPLAGSAWRHVVVCGHAGGSQYDRLIDRARSGNGTLPDRSACIARSGSGFHGSQGRPWSTAPGNIHLTVHFAPDRAVPRFDTVFTALAAVSVVEAIDAIPALRGAASIKWVNDVLLGGAKVAGVLAYTQTQGARVGSVILGIGLNVETAPRIEPSPFVTGATCVRDHADVTTGTVLQALLAALARNYERVLAHGHAGVMDRYRERSAVLGAEVTIRADGGAGAALLAAGRVTGIGDGLELLLDGRAQPVTRGRLAFDRVATHAPPVP